MRQLKYQKPAERDLHSIANYTVRQWNEQQSRRYLDELEKRCQELLRFPELGRACDYIRPGLRRLESGSHVIFYRVKDNTVVVVRILHQGMLPGHRFPESK